MQFYAGTFPGHGSFHSPYPATHKASLCRLGSSVPIGRLAIEVRMGSVEDVFLGGFYSSSPRMVVCGARHSPHVGAPTWGFAYFNVSDVALRVRQEPARVRPSIAEGWLGISVVGISVLATKVVARRATNMRNPMLIPSAWGTRSCLRNLPTSEMLKKGWSVPVGGIDVSHGAMSPSGGSVPW